jgi:hypothetical protein
MYVITARYDTVDENLILSLREIIAAASCRLDEDSECWNTWLAKTQWGLRNFSTTSTYN